MRRDRWLRAQSLEQKGPIQGEKGSLISIKRPYVHYYWRDQLRNAAKTNRVQLIEMTLVAIEPSFPTMVLDQSMLDWIRSSKLSLSMQLSHHVQTTLRPPQCMIFYIAAATRTRTATATAFAEVDLSIDVHTSLTRLLPVPTQAQAQAPKIYDAGNSPI